MVIYLVNEALKHYVNDFGAPTSFLWVMEESLPHLITHRETA